MNSEKTTIVPEVIEQSPGLSETSLATQNVAGVVKNIARQLEILRQGELACLFQRLRIGGMVKDYISNGGLVGRGNGHKGHGLKGWWENNFRNADGELTYSYDQLARWIRAAENLPAILRDKGYDCAKNLTAEKMIALLAMDPELVPEKCDHEILEVAQKEANTTTLRQMLLWGDDAEPRRPGRPAGSGKSGDGEYKEKPAIECAVETVWPTVEYMLKHRGAMFTAYKLLPDEKLAEMRDTLVEHVKAITAVIEMREKHPECRC